MIGRRSVDADKLLDYYDENRKRASIRDLLAKWLRRQPKTPELISRQGCAEMLGRQSAHIDRVIARYGDKFPKPIKVEKGHPVYVKAEIEAFVEEVKNS